MKKKIIIGVSVVAVLLIGLGIYWWCTREERAVKALIGNTAEWMSAKPRTVAHEGVLKHTKSGDFFTAPLSIKVIKPEFDFNVSEDTMERMWMLYFREVDEMNVETENIKVEISGDKAFFSFDSRITGSFSKKKHEFSGVYLVSGNAEKIDGSWKISSIVVEPVVK